jgi:hypothetical protein
MGKRDISRRERVEWFHNYQRRRLVYLECGEGYLDIARRLLKPEVRETREAVRVLLKSACAFQGAGVTHRGKVVWRFARIVHAASVREAMK